MIPIEINSALYAIAFSLALPARRRDDKLQRIKNLDAKRIEIYCKRKRLQGSGFMYQNVSQTVFSIARCARRQINVSISVKN